MPSPTIPINPKDILEAEIPSQKQKGFSWAIEFGRAFGAEEDPVLSIKTQTSTAVIKSVFVVKEAMVVAVEVTKSRSLSFLLETAQNSKFLRVTLDPKMYNFKIHAEQIAADCKSVVGDGFLPSTFTIEKLTKPETKISASDIIAGFQYVKGCMSSEAYSVRSPNTWLAYNMMRDGKIFEGLTCGLFVPRILIFEEDAFDVEAMNEWIQSKKKECEKQEGKKPAGPSRTPRVSTADNDTVIAGGSKPASQPKSTGAKRKQPEPASRPTDPVSRPKEKASKARKPVADAKEKSPPKTEAAKKQSTKPKAQRPKRQKVQSSPRPASSVSVDLFDEDEDLRGEKPEAKLVRMGIESREKISKFYTFGDTVFKVPVESIVSPPPTLVYRCLNKEHAMEIARSMVKNQDREPIVADLIPYSVKNSKLVHYDNTPEDLKDFNNAIKRREIQFVAISGQHSALAAKWVIEWSKTDAKLSAAAKKLCVRRARILSDTTPQTILAEHSMNSNAINKTMEYKSSFLDTVVHARRQWERMSRPKRPVIGDNSRSVEFEVREWTSSLFCFVNMQEPR